MEIPKTLIDQIQEGNVVLFLGAGASIGAIHPQGKKVLQGLELSNLIADKFLDKSYLNKSLQVVSELAISETNLFTVQSFIADLMNYFEPANFHAMLPTFVWKAIATTNYDLIIEKAYNNSSQRAQDLAVIKKNGESIETKLSSRKNLLYLKLHGCITEINNPDLPLILTPDQYVTHRQGRSRLFDRVKELAYEYPFLFIGHSLEDLDIRAILFELQSLKDARPRSYIVSPSVNDYESRLFESKKITSISLTFENFINKINSSVNPVFRKLRNITPSYDQPIMSRFKVSSDVQATSTLLNFIENDVDYLHKAFVTKESDPKAFYKGYFTDWDPIAKNFDVKRFNSDDVLEEIFLTSEDEKDSLQELYVVKGHAGSGKTVFLKRIAWDAAILFDKLCLYAKPNTVINYDSISELFNLCKERIFLFIDPASDNMDTIIYLLNKAKQDNIYLSIITAERKNEWNICCSLLDSFLTQEFLIKYLKDKEIDSLLLKLKQHKSLGYLESMSHEKQVEALSKIAGRELLVALHEATLGKPFAEIIHDEFQSISSSKAQHLYLTISILHRLGVGARAGFISRVHGISFSTFKENLFKPLEYVIFANKNDRINDYVYQTRHQHIADIVFEQELRDSQDRLDEYIKVLSCLDIDYKSDQIAFRGMTNARELLKIFSNHQMIRELYRVAEQRVPGDPFLMQQMAIFEMNSDAGSIKRATEFLQLAHEKAPWSKPIAHSLSELALKKSERSVEQIEKIKYLKDAQNFAQKLITQNMETSHAFHTLIKINLSKLQTAIDENDERSIEEIIKDTEKIISNSKQVFPNDSTILEIESNFCKLIDNEPRAFQCLSHAFSLSKSNPFIALRLAGMHYHSKRIDEAIIILKEALEVNSSDKELNYKIAMYLMEKGNYNLQEVAHYLRRSFTQGDRRYAAHFWYARTLYLMNDIDESLKIFKDLKELNINIKLKREPMGFVCEDNSKILLFSGEIIKVEASHAFIRRDRISDVIFIYRYSNEALEWEDLKNGTRVSFNLAFTYRGPVGLNVIMT